MSNITVENILSQIVQLPPEERRKLRQILQQEEQKVNFHWISVFHSDLCRIAPAK